MAVPFILLGGAALAGITGAVKSVSAHTKNANAKQIVAEAQNIYDEAREMLEEQRTCTAECLKRLGVLKVDIWSKEMNDFIRTFRAFKNVRMESDVAGDERLKLKCQGTENLKNMEVAALKATEIARAGVASLGTGVLAGHCLLRRSNDVCICINRHGHCKSVRRGSDQCNAGMVWRRCIDRRRSGHGGRNTGSRRHRCRAGIGSRRSYHECQGG